MYYNGLNYFIKWYIYIMNIYNFWIFIKENCISIIIKVMNIINIKILYNIIEESLFESYNIYIYIYIVYKVKEKNVFCYMISNFGLFIIVVKGILVWIRYF